MRTNMRYTSSNSSYKVRNQEFEIAEGDFTYIAQLRNHLQCMASTCKYQTEILYGKQKNARNKYLCQNLNTCKIYYVAVLIFKSICVLDSKMSSFILDAHL